MTIISHLSQPENLLEVRTAGSDGKAPPAFLVLSQSTFPVLCLWRVRCLWKQCS